ncbi:ABC transporter ATP-binding protein [Natranaerobius trueperi]|uniref:Peptide ABC transporter ATP-binding protein n=1 Tax=Natranaerobius trueperi TaxID=759412 RepID=A0A226BXN2_9FIRM|nr:ABC transporter ATP-binding protein [Natranaerobius trueperi]OWZ83695.1 peptide ABC transporter ATP-binding protein [Natranaerobius trueperi]
MKKILEVQDLKISFNTYAGKIKAVRGVSFDLFKGETLVVVGESGCGKTVMAKSILKLLPENITELGSSSKVVFQEKDLTVMNEKKIRKFRGKDISMIFQDPMSYLNPTMTVGEQIAESLIIHQDMNKKQALKKTVDILKLVKIPNANERIKQYPHEFSGGMRQRVVIAIALACNPQILLADEPTTALDVTIQAEILELIQELQDRLDTAVMLITHDLGIAAEVADRIQVMYAGEIVERGTKEEVFNSPKHPYTWALLRSVPTFKTKDQGTLYSLGGTPPDLLDPPSGCAFAARCEYAMNICKKSKPQHDSLTNTHFVSCWLNHPMAPKVDIPKSIRKVI